MNNARLLPALGCLILLAPGVVAAQSPEIDLKKSPLHRFVGEWEKEITFQLPTGPQTKNGVHSCDWILNGAHLQETGRDSDGTEYRVIYSWDRSANAFTMSLFHSSGDVTQFTGQWDEPTSTFIWTGKIGERLATSEYKFQNDDSFVIQFTISNAQREKLFRLEATATRKVKK